MLHCPDGCLDSKAIRREATAWPSRGSEDTSRSSIVGELAISAMPRKDAEQVENVTLKESVTLPSFQRLKTSSAAQHESFYRRGCNGAPDLRKKKGALNERPDRALH